METKKYTLGSMVTNWCCLTSKRKKEERKKRYKFEAQVARRLAEPMQPRAYVPNKHIWYLHQTKKSTMRTQPQPIERVNKSHYREAINYEIGNKLIQESKRIKQRQVIEELPLKSSKETLKSREEDKIESIKEDEEKVSQTNSEFDELTLEFETKKVASTPEKNNINDDRSIQVSELSQTSESDWDIPRVSFQDKEVATERNNMIDKGVQISIESLNMINKNCLTETAITSASVENITTLDLSPKSRQLKTKIVLSSEETIAKPSQDCRLIVTDSQPILSRTLEELQQKPNEKWLKPTRAEEYKELRPSKSLIRKDRWSYHRCCFSKECPCADDRRMRINFNVNNQIKAESNRTDKVKCMMSENLGWGKKEAVQALYRTSTAMGRILSRYAEI